jgi:hypothetical protein
MGHILIYSPKPDFVRRFRQRRRWDVAARRSLAAAPKRKTGTFLFLDFRIIKENGNVPVFSSEISPVS